MAMRPEGDNVIKQPIQHGSENVSLSAEGNSRTTDTTGSSPLQRIGNLAAVENFNKNFNPANYSTEDLAAQLDQNSLALQGHMAYMAGLGARMGKAQDQSIASNVLDPTGNEFKIENA